MAYAGRKRKTPEQIKEAERRVKKLVDMVYKCGGNRGYLRKYDVSADSLRAMLQGHRPVMDKALGIK